MYVIYKMQRNSNQSECQLSFTCDFDQSNFLAWKQSFWTESQIFVQLKHKTISFSYIYNIRSLELFQIYIW